MMVHKLETKPGRTVIADGKECLFFSGYDYLGINNNSEFAELVKEGISKYGWIFSSSRISNTHLDLYERFENLLSRITNTEATVCFSSGYAAGNAAIAIHDEVFNAPTSHPAIKKANTKQQSYENWCTEVTQLIDSHLYKSPFVIASDAVDPLTASINDFSFLRHLSKPVIAIIDDSHGIGLIGVDGSGISATVPKKQNIQYCLTYSLSKAFGLVGGAISCSIEEAERYRKLPSYTAATSISPALMFAFLNGQHIYEQQRKKLQANIKCMSALLNKSNVKFHPDLSIFVLPGAINVAELYRNDIIISSFAYPDPAGKKIRRIVVNALHTEEDLQQAAEAVILQLHKM